MLIICTCRPCQRQVNYLAADLLPIFGELRPVGRWQERARYATSDDVGTVLPRRPAGFRQVRQWKGEWYEKPASPPAK